MFDIVLISSDRTKVTFIMLDSLSATKHVDVENLPVKLQHDAHNYRGVILFIK